MARVRFPAGVKDSSTASRQHLEPTQRLIQWVPGTFPPGVKRRGHEAIHSAPSSAEVKNGGAIPPLHHTCSWLGTFATSWISKKFGEAYAKSCQVNSILICIDPTQPLLYISETCINLLSFCLPSPKDLLYKRLVPGITSGMELGVHGGTRRPLSSRALFLLMKLFSMIYNVMNVIPNNDTCKNDFPNLHCNNFLCVTESSDTSSGVSVHLLLKSHFHPCIRYRDLIETCNFYVNTVLMVNIKRNTRQIIFIFEQCYISLKTKACYLQYKCTSRATIMYLWKCVHSNSRSTYFHACWTLGLTAHVTWKGHPTLCI
jgi:hypothetical protein